MLDSFLANQTLVERCLSKMRLYDSMCSDEECKLITALSQFLKVFTTATEVLCGQKYPTVSLVLLFRAEIENALEIIPSDCAVVQELKENMKAKLDHRMPVTELYVVAAMLDPSQRNLSTVQDFIQKRKTTAVDLLTKFLNRYTNEPDELQQDGSGEGAEGLAKRTGNSADEAPWKKAKVDLLAKHSSSQACPSREIMQYRCISISTADPLQWWETQIETFSRLSGLARGLLAVPATSAPSERVFSIAGIVLNAKRSSLSPHVVDKVLFIHENMKFLTDI